MVMSDDAVLSTVFRQALMQYHDGDYELALEGFSEAHLNTSRDHIYYNKYLSYHGLVLVLLGRPRGLEMCRNAAANENFDGEVYLNLARAECQTGNRKACVQALQRGLRVAPDNLELKAMRRSLGMRRKPFVRFLDRDHPLNVMLGKVTYRGRNAPA